jgi:outer membrane immunogenic protein
MQKTLFTAGLALTACLGFAGAASAADVYSTGGMKDAPVYSGTNWTGFYIGANAGYGWAASPEQLVYYEYTPGLTPTGGFAGAQIGYNWQYSPHFVFGVEADIQFASISDRAIVDDDSYSLTTDARLNWFGTVRGKIGYATGNALIYATGGLAYGSLHKEYTYTDDSTYYGNATVTGYAVGAGLEYKWSPNFGVKAEYQYLNFGKNNFCEYQASSSCWNSSSSPLATDDFHTVRLGVNYYPNGDFVPLK